MSDKVYDTLKIVAIIVMPVADFIATFCTIWGLPYGPQLCATLTAIHTLLGAILVKSNINYKAKQEKENNETV